MSFDANKAAEGSRTLNLQITNPTAIAESSEKHAGPAVRAVNAQRAIEESESGSDVRELLHAWPRLPQVMRGGILAMIRAVVGE
jgi:hypothetical protein